MSRRSSFLRACFLSATLFVAPFRCPAQLLQGTINGNVTDPTGAAISGATVRVTSEGTAIGREATTNSLGGYSLPTLPPGTYDLTVNAPGFSAYSQKGIVVRGNEVTRVDAAMVVGAVNSNITVSESAAELQTD